MATQTKLMTSRTVIRLVFILILFPMTPMIISGAWNWWEAWAYLVINVLGFIVSRVLAARRNPDIIAERARSMELQGAKSWDRLLAPMLALGYLLILLVAGFDKAFGWTSPFTLNTKLIALFVIVLGIVFSSWALIENKFFSGVVRIQTDRGQLVVTTGPYRFVRHPGYAGGLWTYLAMPLLFDSLWAFIPTVLLVAVLILRTSLEDRTLQAELSGYKEYTQQTRYRLFPGIW